jgi:SAM-dependent methyltransferase
MSTPRYDDQSLRSRGAGRARELPRRLGVDPGRLRGSRILEVGCGNGETTMAVRDLYGADVMGVEPFPRYLNTAWAAEPIFLKADICDVQGIAPFDFVHSYTVWEHIDRPKLALRKVHELLKPGGRAYLVYNLYRGATAAHLAAYIDIPWVHLLYTEEEIRAMMKARHGRDRGPSWVNKLTWAHYLAYFAEIGFAVEKVWYTLRRMEPEFYRQHEAKLKAYPIEDLERNFMHVTLRRPEA